MKAGLYQRRLYSVIVCSDQAWPMIAKIVEIGAVENMRIALGARDVLKCGIERCLQ